ncbi:MAG: hypothetical protein JJ59_05190 [Candidatus Micrarchaeum sp. AZ1]|jgi:thiamine phosphate synthase YjbQ (UPF0047 family)|nr:MAG: hypothetical protein JJ59_05190 [Candidatus Micrarchaeum sp. AZ1]
MDGRKKKNRNRTYHIYPDIVVEAKETLKVASGKALLGKGTWDAAHIAERNLRRLQRLESG